MFVSLVLSQSFCFHSRCESSMFSSSLTFSLVAAAFPFVRQPWCASDVSGCLIGYPSYASLTTFPGEERSKSETACDSSLRSMPTSSYTIATPASDSKTAQASAMFPASMNTVPSPPSECGGLWPHVPTHTCHNFPFCTKPQLQRFKPTHTREKWCKACCRSKAEEKCCRHPQCAFPVAPKD